MSGTSQLPPGAGPSFPQPPALPCISQQGNGTVDITTLPATQLSALQARLSQEIEHLSTSHIRLRSAQQRFRECIKSIEGVRAQQTGITLKPPLPPESASKRKGQEGEKEYPSACGNLLETCFPLNSLAVRDMDHSQPASQAQCGLLHSTSQKKEKRTRRRKRGSPHPISTRLLTGVNKKSPLLAFLVTQLSDPEILVPLTSSLYVSGTLADRDRFIVDVGTGFYVEKVPDLPLPNSYRPFAASRFPGDFFLEKRKKSPPSPLPKKKIPGPLFFCGIIRMS